MIGWKKRTSVEMGNEGKFSGRVYLPGVCSGARTWRVRIFSSKTFLSRPTETEQDPMVLATLVLSWSLQLLSSACLLYVEKLQPNNKFNKRIEKIHKGKHSNETK